jgi:hypothetical protein
MTAQLGWDHSVRPELGYVSTERPSDDFFTARFLWRSPPAPLATRLRRMIGLRVIVSLPLVILSYRIISFTGDAEGRSAAASMTTH